METNKAIIVSEIDKVKIIMINHIKSEISSLDKKQLDIMNDYFVELDKKRTIISFNKDSIDVYNNKKRNEIRSYQYENLSIDELSVIVDFIEYKSEIINEDVA
ncbi:hypothetical protein M0Q50_02040 [bacterium]|jgi:hypothetical protein|nr:hypothetical protein [bacterium]